MKLAPLARQERDELADFLGTSDAADRMAGAEHLEHLGVAVRGAQDRRVDHSRADRIHPDVLRRQINGGALDRPITPNFVAQ